MTCHGEACVGILSENGHKSMQVGTRKKPHNWSKTSRSVNHIEKLHKATKFTSQDSKNWLFCKAPVEPLSYQGHKNATTGPKNHPFRHSSRKKKDNCQMPNALLEWRNILLG